VSSKSEAPRAKARGNLLRRSSLGYAGRVFAEPSEAKNAIFTLHSHFAAKDGPPRGNLRCQGYRGQEPRGFLAEEGEGCPEVCASLSALGGSAMVETLGPDSTSRNYSFIGGLEVGADSRECRRSKSVILKSFSASAAPVSSLPSTWRMAGFK